MKKIANLPLYLLSGTLLFLACSKDDPDKPTPVEEQNTAPVIKAQTFTVLESATEIGTVDASDEDGDQLTFSITVNDNALFAMDNTGKITLAEGKALDFDTTPSHTITVQVEDKEDKASAQMTINLTDTNDIAPVFEEEGYSFEAFEDIAQDVVMGTVAGSDPEGAPVTYKIIADENELFAIDGNTGEITLAEGKQLDFEAFEGAEPVHNIVVQISDGELTAEVNVAITVKNIVETLAEDPNSFVTTWTTMANEHITIGIDPNYTYDFTVDWGDGTVEQIGGSEETSFSHFYETPGTYTVAIIGDFPTISMHQVNFVERLKLQSIDQWGSIVWKSMRRAFFNCGNMVYNATDTPNLTQVTNMSEMFANADSFNGNLSNWDTSNITNMAQVFNGIDEFQGMGIETWNTQNVASMDNMFASATAFDQNLGNWDISSVTNMENMLDGTAMSNENYGNTLIGWATLDQDEEKIPTGIELGAAGLQYSCDLTPDADNAHDTLSADPYNWNIQDESPVDCGGGL